MRQSKHFNTKGNARGGIIDAVSIHDRPTEVNDRIIPGHWEGDLICGSQKSYIATLVERSSQFPVGMMCRLLSVFRSGYYAWKHRPPSVREQSNRLLKIEIKRVLDDEKGRPRAPRIARRPQDEGEPAGRHRIARIMKDNGWRAKAARKYLDAP
jgi:hypothetical protein